MSPSSVLVQVGFQGEALRSRAEVLARTLGLPLENPGIETPLRLEVTRDGLTLALTGPGTPGSIRVDFASGRLGYRHTRVSPRGEPLARAIGLRGDGRPTVVDATAGLGRDGFILASLGCRVTLVERDPVIASLLRDGLDRAFRLPALVETIGRMRCVQEDARDYLARLTETERPDVIYLDPMYPHRDKSALVKKEMRVFRALVGDDADADRLLDTALRVAGRRVVVKRPVRAEPLGGREPGHRTSGRTTRFDVYVKG